MAQQLFDERILIVEDNKALAKLLAQRMAKTLPFEVDIAFNLKEARLFTAKSEYFLALLDINLPDAPDGQVVDYMISKGVSSIVLSGLVDREFRQSILSKNVIDYVAKGTIADIDVVCSLISRLSNNRNYKVMVVDDSNIFRNQMKQILEMLQFRVTALSNAEEALNILEHDSSYRIVLLDYEMNGMNGLELTKELRKKHVKDDLMIIAISSSEDPEISAMFLKYGASDFIRKPYIREEFICRINNSIDSIENIDKIRRSAHRDPLTGLYLKNFFLTLADEYFLKTIELSSKFSLSIISIDNYDGIKEGYGETMADAAAIRLSDVLKANVSDRDIIGKLGENEFIVLLKDVGRVETEAIIHQIANRFAMYPITFLDGSELPVTISAGVKVTPEHNIEETINCADMMLFEALKEGGESVKYQA